MLRPRRLPSRPRRRESKPLRPRLLKPTAHAKTTRKFTSRWLLLGRRGGGILCCYPCCALMMTLCNLSSQQHMSPQSGQDHVLGTCIKNVGSALADPAWKFLRPCFEVVQPPAASNLAEVSWHVRCWTKVACLDMWSLYVPCKLQKAWARSGGTSPYPRVEVLAQDREARSQGV